MKYSSLIMLLILFSCNGYQNKYFEFDPRRESENNIFSLSMIADDIKYIRLDNSFPIDFIYYPKYFVNGHIYLSSLNSGVMIFDRNGKFVRRIGRIGRGPGEYINYYKFTVDNKNGSIYVLDNSSNSVKVYSVSGNFIRNLSLNEFDNGPDAIEFLNSNLILSFFQQFPGIKNEWIILDTLGLLIKKKERSLTPFTSNWLIDGGMYRFDNKVCRWNPFNDTVYSILPDYSTKVSFLFNKGDHRLPLSDIQIENLKLYFKPHILFETKRFFVLRYKYNKIRYELIGKEDMKSYRFDLLSNPATYGDNFSGGIANDLDGGLSFQPENYFVENGREYLVGLLYPINLKEHLLSDSFKKSSPKFVSKKLELEKLSENLKETDNPILMIVRLKK